MQKIIRHIFTGLLLGASIIVPTQAQIAPEGAQNTISAPSNGKELDPSKLKPGWQISFYNMKGNEVGEVPVKSLIIPVSDKNPYALLNKLKMPKDAYAFQLNGYLHITEAGKYGLDFMASSQNRTWDRCVFSMSLAGETLFHENSQFRDLARNNKMVDLAPGFIPIEIKAACRNDARLYEGMSFLFSVKKPYDQEAKAPDANFIVHDAQKGE